MTGARHVPFRDLYVHSSFCCNSPGQTTFTAVMDMVLSKALVFLIIHGIWLLSLAHYPRRLHISARLNSHEIAKQGIEAESTREIMALVSASDWYEACSINGQIDR